jgi:hypothetical protein
VAARLHEAREGVVGAQHHEESDDERVDLEAVRVAERPLHGGFDAGGEVQDYVDDEGQEGEGQRARERAAAEAEQQGPGVDSSLVVSTSCESSATSEILGPPQTTHEVMKRVGGGFREGVKKTI